MSTQRFRQAFPGAPLAPKSLVNKGKKIPFSLAEDCITNYISIMSEHGFKVETDRAASFPGGTTRRLTVSEDFDAAEVNAFLQDASARFATTFPGRPVLTRLTLGIYTNEMLDDPELGLTEEEKEERRGRMTIFIIPYVEPNEVEVEEIVATRLNAMAPLATAGATEAIEAVAQENVMFFGPGDFAYDFGGLQP